MMVAWAPDLVTSAELADLDASMEDAKEIHDAIIRMIHTTVSYVLKEADTGDLGLWGFIYVLLVFMRSLKTRHNLLQLFGWAFHAELLAPFLNMLLREDQTRGGGAWESASQPEFLTLCSPLNQIEKPGIYGAKARDLVMSYNHAREEDQKAEGVTEKETAVTTEETAEEATASDAAHERDRDTKTPDAEPMYTGPLPEHEMLRGNIFAREPDSPWYKYPAKTTEDAVVQPCPPAPKVTAAAVQPAEGVVAEQAQAESPVDLKTEREAPEVEQKEGENEDARREDERKGGKVEETRQEDEQKESEDEESEDEESKDEEARRDEEQREEREAEKERQAEEGWKEAARRAEVERQEALLRDPPFFPADWFKNSKYDYEERLVRKYSVQDAGTCEDRSRQILWMAFQLMGTFFNLQTDEDGRHSISVPGAQSVPPLDLDKKMPEVVERIGGARVVYVDRSIYIAEMERNRQKEKAEGDTEEVSAANNIPEAS